MAAIIKLRKGERGRGQGKVRHLKFVDMIDRRGEQTALVYKDRAISFAALAERSQRLARGLSELGIGKGDRVAFWLPNTPDYLALFFACARLGAIAVSVNTRFRESEVADILSRSGAKALVLWPSFLGVPFLDILGAIDPKALAGVETLILYGEAGETRPDRLPAVGRRAVTVADLARRVPLGRPFPAENQGCAVFTTSGTTKAPKFVLHGQHGVAAHATDVASAFGYDRRDAKMLLPLPLCGVFGFTQAMAALAGGRPQVIMPVFDADAAARLIHRHGITDFNGGDDLIQRLLDAVPGDRPFPTLDGMGWAAFNSALANLPYVAEKRGLRLFGLYGMSEVHALYSRWPIDMPIAGRIRAGGRPVSPSAKVRARDPESGRILPHGEAGEIELCGPSLMLEYFSNPDATRETFTGDGYIRTGDLGMTEAGGGFEFLTRMGDVLRLGGFLVAPAEIESTLLEVPGLADAQVVAVPGPSGTRAVGFVIVKPGAIFDEAAAIAHCRARIAKYKVPARVIALDAYPTTPSANGTKIQRAKLRAMAEAELTQR